MCNKTTHDFILYSQANLMALQITCLQTCKNTIKSVVFMLFIGCVQLKLHTIPCTVYNFVYLRGCELILQTQ
jgi:hypothetical protein